MSPESPCESNFLWPGRDEAEHGPMDRPAESLWTINVPSVASNGTDDSMDVVENCAITDCVPSVPPVAHNMQQRGSKSDEIREGLGALSLIAEDGSLVESGSSSRTRRSIHASTDASCHPMQLLRWQSYPERYEVIACGLRSGSFASLTDLHARKESLLLLLNQIEPIVNPQPPRIFEPQVGSGPQQFEPQMYLEQKVSFVGLPKISRITLDDGSQAADLNPEDNFRNIMETHRDNFRGSLLNLAGKDQALANRLIHRLGAQVNLILPLFDGRGLDALLLPEYSGKTEHTQYPKPAQSVGSTVPNARGSMLKGRGQGSGKRSRDAERDDNGKDQNSKRNKKHPPSSPPSSKKATRPRFKCPFNAKCCITHCRKNERLSTSQGYAQIHHLLDHFKEYHTVVRCQRCYMVFEGPTPVSSKNDHQRMCKTTKPLLADDVIDCDMKAKLDEKLRFRTWALRNENDPDMKYWISANVSTLSGITRSGSELTDKELKDLASCERELAKWYTIWKALFESLPVPLHPFHEPNVPQAVQNRQRFQFLFRHVVNATADERGLPPANDFQGQTEWFSNCLSETLGLLLFPSSENTSAQGEGFSSREQLLSDLSSVIGMQGMMSSLAPQWNGSTSSEPMTRDAGQNQQTLRHLVRGPITSDVTAGNPSSTQTSSLILNTTAGNPLSVTQDPKAVVPIPTPVSNAQSHASLGSYSQAMHTESQGQDPNQTPPVGGIELVCETCYGLKKVWSYLYSPTGSMEDCLCAMHNPHNPIVGNDDDLYNA
ncbi:hypothetical protein BGZ60DRAFT_527955 [Tricladium varicosporioides]|nr:hypothetical protein BGZ60DRAFT_527955 [Hymenoscyphus varicosporioides]